MTNTESGKKQEMANAESGRHPTLLDLRVICTPWMGEPHHVTFACWGSIYRHS